MRKFSINSQRIKSELPMAFVSFFSFLVIFKIRINIWRKMSLKIFCDHKIKLNICQNF